MKPIVLWTLKTKIHGIVLTYGLDHCLRLRDWIIIGEKDTGSLFRKERFDHYFEKERLDHYSRKKDSVILRLRGEFINGKAVRAQLISNRHE
jgi:hypothetical protein